MSTGAVTGVGSNGYYWSATPYSATYGYYLGFSSTNVSPSNYNSRGYGFAVRCVSE